jgi:hypothetical protein
MARPKPPLFLARAMYRRRRLRDVARLLPLVGLFLLLLPLLWAPETEARLGSVDVLYFFGIWLILIGAAASLAPGLSKGEPAGEEEED